MVNFSRILAAIVLVSLAAGGWVWPGDRDLTHPAISITASVAMIAWGWGGLELLSRSALAPRVWLLGAALMLNHVAAAFHFGHDWSQQQALEHTRRTAGVAEGLYVNYAFSALWLADALWLNAAPGRYSRRPRWVGWLLHGFLSFIVFNATVVYGSWQARLQGVILFAVLFGFFLARRRAATATITRKSVVD